MKLELESNDIKLILFLLQRSDPMGVYTMGIQTKINDQLKTVHEEVVIRSKDSESKKENI